MNNSLLSPSSSQRPPANAVNPFARALAEARGGQPQDNQFGSQQNFAEQQRLQAEQLKREKLRAQLHKQVNPVEATDVFNAREQQVKKQIDDIRQDLRKLAVEVDELHKEIDITLLSNVSAPGEEGKYYVNFFQKLREWILLLRQKVHSARTWATTFNSKKKRRKKNAVGLDIAGKSYEQTTAIYDRMHHERSTVYSGS